MRKKIWVELSTTILILALFLFVRPANAYMQINNGAACTTSQGVTLSIPAFNIHTFEVQYRASENRDLLSKLRWLSLGTNSVGFSLTSGQGIKKVYFQTRTRVRLGVGGPTASHDWKYSQIVSNTIKYLPSCEDPRFMGLISLSIPKQYEPFRFDVFYSFEVVTVNAPQNLQINIFAGVGKRNIPIASKTIGYAGVPVGTGRMKHTGTLTVSVPTGSSSQPAYSSLKFIAKIEPKPGSSVAADINLNNNMSSKGIQLVKRTQSRTHPVRSCLSAEGDKNNILVPVGNAWVIGGSKLTLNDCGSTTGNEKKCDNNPVPGLGLRGVRWTRRPSTGGNYGLHWYCEGYANKRDNSSWGYYFRFRVEYDIVEIRVVQ